MFEAKVVEQTGSLGGCNQPSRHFRLGFSIAGSQPIIGDTEESIAFDAQASALLFNQKQTPIARKFDPTSVIGVVLNLDGNSPNANTVSLFRDGERISEPLPLPERLKGQELFPTVTFRGYTVHLNLGPTPHERLPFRCHMFHEAAQEDAKVIEHVPSEDGKCEILFPICLPDEGTFRWLDWFLEHSPKRYA
jgi:hypothetical protein